MIVWNGSFFDLRGPLSGSVSSPSLEFGRQSVIGRKALADKDAIAANGYALIGLCALALTAIAAHSLGIGGTGTPTIVSPYPIPLVLPAFMGIPRIAVGMAVGLIFAAWSWQFLRQEFHIPRRSLVLFMTGIALSAANFIVGWADGGHFQGCAYVLACLAISIVLVLILVATLLRNRTAPSAYNFLGFHAGLFGWLATYAIPFLGEGP